MRDRWFVSDVSVISNAPATKLMRVTHGPLILKLFPNYGTVDRLPDVAVPPEASHSFIGEDCRCHVRLLAATLKFTAESASITKGIPLDNVGKSLHRPFDPRSLVDQNMTVPGQYSLNDSREILG
jgi:hypothetical protein